MNRTVDQILEEEFSPVDIEGEFEKLLEFEEPVNIMGIEYSVSWVLKQIDECAYNEHCNNYADQNLHYNPLDGEYYSLDDYDKAEQVEDK